MSYSLVIKRQAKKKLLSLSRTDRFRIAEQIEMLGDNPDNPALDVKKLIGQPFYRLRVGQWRIIFDRQDNVKIIAIETLNTQRRCLQMSLQIIKSVNGKPEYVLLPISVYRILRRSIEKELAHTASEEYEPFQLEDYIDNPVALARIKAKITQEELADAMGVTQAYISRIEHQDLVSPKTLIKINAALNSLRKRRR